MDQEEWFLESRRKEEIKMKTFEEIKTKGMTMNDKERIAFLEDCLDWAMEYWKLDKEDFRKAEARAIEAEKELAELKSALRKLL